MRYQQSITILSVFIVAIAGVTSATGIFSNAGDGNFIYESIRGETIEIYGKGLYQHMSADVAIQGIAQDYVTLFIAIPLLIAALVLFRKGSGRGQLLLSGVLGYLLVTYLFYTAMGMYNYLFLAYVALMGLSFFAFFLTLWSIGLASIQQYFSDKAPIRFVGWFLVINCILIALMWLNVVVPPLLDGSVYPNELQHYTTLIVQGFDLGLLLPIGFVVGTLMIYRKTSGLLFGTPYVVFLALLMTSLTGKIIAMGWYGVNVIPAVFIIPAINLIAIGCAVGMLKNAVGKMSETPNL